MNIMHRNSAGHLTDDQIDDALIGSLDHEASGHLATCSHCAVRLAEARMPLTSFKAVSTAWSERRSATLPQVSIQNSSRPQRLAWGAAVVTAALGLVIAIPFVQKYEHVNEAAATTIVAPQQLATANPGPVLAPAAVREESAPKSAISDDERISRDNQMLDTIDQELDASASSTGALELEPVEIRRSGQKLTPTEQD